MFLKWMWKSACLSRDSQRNSWRIKLHLVVGVCQCNDYVWKHECKPSAACYIVTIKTRRSLLSTKGNKRGMMNACCVCVNAYVSGLTWSCWASWFSSPSTIGANLSLLFLSAAIVIAARILSKLVENREQTQKSTNTFITWPPGHLLTVFTSGIMYLIFPCVLARTFTQPIFGQSDKFYRFQSLCLQFSPLLLQCPILTVTKAMADKSRVFLQMCLVVKATVESCIWLNEMESKLLEGQPD